MEYENLNIGDRIDYKDFPGLFGEELTFEQLFAESSCSLLLIWRAAFIGASVEDVKQAVVGRIERIVDEEEGPEYASIMLDVGERSPLDMEIEDMTKPENVPEAEIKRTWNLYDRVWRVRKADAAIVEAAPAQEIDAVEQAQALHRRIVNDAQIAAESLWDLCTAIKEMRDGKHYKALLYANFEGYCEEGLGMSRAQAYRYISIAEGMTPENVSSMRQIGTTKLALLAQVTEEQREAVAQAVDVESATVRELRAQIEALKADAANKEKLLTQAREDSQKSYEEVLERQEEIDDLKSRLKERTEHINDMKAQIDELENRPVEVAVQTDSAALEQLRAEHQAAESELLREIDKLKADLAQASEGKPDAYNAIMAEISFLNNCVRSTCTRISAVQNENDRKSLIQYLRGIAAIIETASEGGR